MYLDQEVQEKWLDSLVGRHLCHQFDGQDNNAPALSNKVYTHDTSKYLFQDT